MVVDVLLPYYGDAELMKQAVRSVLDQHHRDFRLVVIDDAYPDDVIARWLKSLGDERIEYHRNDTNLGVNGNFRKALTFVRNELVVIMGTDDVMLPTHLSWLVATAERHPQAQIFQPGVFVIDGRGAPSNTLVERMKSYYRPNGSGVRLLGGEALAASLLRGDWLYFPSLGWRAGTICGVGFRPEYEVVPDLALVLDIVMHGGTLVLDDTVTFCYRRHSTSVSSWRAQDGSRFAEERRYFGVVRRELSSLGWNRASRIARMRLSSRLHAITQLPKALVARDVSSARQLVSHVLSK